ncbi:MAG: tRNA pseudouridine(55) synthase TruB [Ruminococcaceae bacterium]|nr:tRNA pseudouridine(55) synthase TruB [Oscillospiraceae bacterium]
MQGLLLLNKPSGITSFGAVARIKRLAGEKRVGHTGTLDPMATGVLPIFLGRATALSSYLLEADKRYIAEIKLGITTDTCDITGNVISQKSVDVKAEKLDAVLGEFKGVIMQTPPMFSAIKQNGVRLYDIARKGGTVDIPKRQVTVYSLEVISPLSLDNTFKIDVKVSKGTYIRSLARDIGEALGCGATLTSLERTETSGFSVSDCIDLESLTEDNIGDYIVSEERAIPHIKELFVTPRQAERFSNGGQLAFDRLGIDANFADGELFRVKEKQKFIGIGYADLKNSQIAIKCIINHNSKE